MSLPLVYWNGAGAPGLNPYVERQDTRPAAVAVTYCIPATASSWYTVSDRYSVPNWLICAITY